MTHTDAPLSRVIDQPVDRILGTESRDDATVRVITVRRRYPAAVEDVWDALTDPERLPRWFLPVTGDLRVGGHYQFEGNAGGTVRACLPPRRAELTWEMGGNTTWLEIELVSVADDTELVLRHIANVGDEATEFWDTYGPGAVGVGWDLALVGLGTHLISGEALDPERFQVWTASADGRAFVQTSSDGWVGASIAAGTDPDAARTAGANTFAFYTTG